MSGHSLDCINEFTAVGSNSVSSQLCRVCRHAVVMVSAGVYFGGKGIMQLIPHKVKVNGKL